MGQGEISRLPRADPLCIDMIAAMKIPFAQIHSGDGKVGEIFIAPEDILSKQMQLAIPASTNTEQLAAIAKSI